MQENTQRRNMEMELNQALSVMELEERFEMTAAAADALRCGDNNSCTIIQSASALTVA